MAGLDNAAFGRLIAIIKSEDSLKVPVGTTFALIDPSDGPLVLPYKWSTAGRYAFAIIDGKRVMMHRLILDPPDDLLVDHEDGDGLNNQRYNLRACTHSENMRNRNKASGESKFKGVWLSRNSWRAEINLNGKKIRLGSFDTETKAAKAYDRAAIELFGDFAKTNRQLGLL